MPEARARRSVLHQSGGTPGPKGARARAPAMWGRRPAPATRMQAASVAGSSDAIPRSMPCPAVRRRAAGCWAVGGGRRQRQHGGKLDLPPQIWPPRQAGPMPLGPAVSPAPGRGRGARQRVESGRPFSGRGGKALAGRAACGRRVRWARRVQLCRCENWRRSGDPIATCGPSAEVLAGLVGPGPARVAAAGGRAAGRCPEAPLLRFRWKEAEQGPNPQWTAARFTGDQGLRSSTTIRSTWGTSGLHLEGGPKGARERERRLAGNSERRLAGSSKGASAFRRRRRKQRVCVISGVRTIDKIIILLVSNSVT